jgi:hypothetical protein
MKKSFLSFLHYRYDHIITRMSRVFCTNSTRTTKSLNDKILKANPITKSPSMVDIKLHSHRLLFEACMVDQLLILFILFQPKPVPVRSTVKYLQKSFGGGFIKDNIIPTKPYHPTKIDAPVSSSLFSLPLKPLVQGPNK